MSTIEITVSDVVVIGYREYDYIEIGRNVYDSVEVPLTEVPFLIQVIQQVADFVGDEA